MHNISIYCIYIYYISGIEITVGGRENQPEIKKLTRKFKVFTEKTD